MDAEQIVVGKVEADRGFKVGQLLAESFRQPRVSPVHHLDRDVLAFDVRTLPLARAEKSSCIDSSCSKCHASL